MRGELQNPLKAAADTRAASRTMGYERPTFLMSRAPPSQDFWEIILVQKLQKLRSELGLWIFLFLLLG